MRKVAWATTVVLAILAVLALLWALRSIAWLFVLSLLIAAMARVPLDRLTREWKFSRSAAIGIVYGVGLLGLVGLGLIVAFPLLAEIQLVAEDLSGTYGQFAGRWQTSERWGAILVQRLPTTEQMTAWLGGNEQLFAAFITFAQGAADLIGEVLMALVLSLYWTADSLHFERLWLSLLAPMSRVRARIIWRAVEAGVGAYLRSEMIQSLLAGALLTLGFLALGIRYPYLWSLLIALSWLIPLVGGILPLAPLWLIVSVNTSPAIATLAVLYTLLVLCLMEFYLEPRLYRRERYTQVLVLLVMLALADLYGWFGLLVAPILATALQIFLNESARAPEPLTVATPGNPQLEILDERLASVRALITQPESPVGIRTTSLFTRLEQLMEKAKSEV